MTFYAKLDGNRIVGVLEADAAPPGMVLLANGWPGWNTRPSSAHRPFLQAGFVVWADPRTLAQHKIDQWGAIKQARDEAETAPFTYDGRQYQCDTQSQARVLAAAQAATTANMGFTWTTAANENVELTAAEMQELAAAMAAHIAAAHDTARSLRAQIDAATTVEAVQAVTWPT